MYSAGEVCHKCAIKHITTVQVSGTSGRACTISPVLVQVTMCEGAGKLHAEHQNVRERVRDQDLGAA